MAILNVQFSNGKKFGFRMVGPFENGPSKRSVFKWIWYSNVRYSSPDCIIYEPPVVGL